VAPHPPGEFAFGIEKSLTPEQVRERAPEHLKILLPGPDPYELIQCNQYSVHQRCASTFKVGKVLLAGDAAVQDQWDEVDCSIC